MNRITSHSVFTMPLLAACILFAFPQFLIAATINVPADHATIQAAIDASTDGDTVLVAPGTYTENINFNGALNPPACP